jgi:hypothetical protein
MEDSCLNKPRYAEQSDEQVDEWIPGRDVCSPEIWMEGLGQAKNPHSIGNKEAEKRLADHSSIFS